MKILSLSKIALVSALVTIGSFFSSASAETTDLGNMVPEVVYSWPQYCTVTGQYTPTQSGTVKFVYDTTILALYTSPDHNENSEIFGEFSYTDGGKIKTYENLQEGVTYYVYNAYALDAGTVIIYEGSSELQMTSTLPSLDPEASNYYGGKMSASSTYEMLVNFNFPVTIGNVFLVAPDNSRAAVTSRVSGSAVACDIAPAMMELYHDNKIKEGDEVILRIFQVKDANDPENKFNGNGRCEVKFNVAAKPLELVEIIGASRSAADNEFCSYYLPGDENALIKFVFDGDLSSEHNGIAAITYGDSDNLEIGIYHEDVEALNDGETAIFDFSGKRRRPIDMLPASGPGTQPEHMYISFKDLFSPDGQYAYTGSKSNPNGYGLSFALKILQYTIVGDFTPARGTALTSGQPMEIWVMNGDKIRYETIRFEYSENGEEKYYDMPQEDVTEEADPFSDGAMLYTFLIPELPCDAETPVKVRMTGLQCADGLDHSNDVYGEFTYAQSGVADIWSDSNATFDVYDIAGVRVLRNADRNALNGLAKGVYIVNGKKFVIR